MELEFGFSDDLFDQSLTDSEFSHMHDAGFGCIEVWATGPAYNPESLEFARPYRQRLEGLGFRIKSYHHLDREGDLATLNSTERTAAVEWAKFGIEHMKILGADTLILHSGGERTDATDRRQEMANLTASLHELVKYCATAHLRIALENLTIPRIAGDANLLEEIVYSFDPALVGFCYDSSHANMKVKRHAEFLSRFRERVFALHLSDNMGVEDDHLPPFEGTNLWPQIIQLLREADFQGVYHFEVHVAGEAHQEVMQRMARGRERLEALLRL